MPHTLFISDLHLQASEPKTVQAWAYYMSHTQADAIFILGDLFEVWVGDDIDDPYHIRPARLVRRQLLQDLALAAAVREARPGQRHHHRGHGHQGRGGGRSAPAATDWARMSRMAWKSSLVSTGVRVSTARDGRSREA